MEEIAFRQPSDIGYIRCRVAVSIGFCDVCEATSGGSSAPASCAIDGWARALAGDECDRLGWQAVAR